MTNESSGLLLRNAATAAASFIAIAIGLHALRGFAGAGGEPLVSPIWPATGVHIALVWLWGYRVLPGLVVGAALANLTSSPDVARMFAYTAAQAVEATVSVWLLCRIAGERSPSLLTRRAAYSLLAAGLVGPLAAALTAGILLKLLVAPAIGVEGIDWRFWSAWLIADGISAIVITPVAVTWREHRPIPWTQRPRVQAACLAAGLLATCWLVFARHAEVTWLRTELLVFLTIPFLVWAALSFGAFGASLTLLGLCVVSITATLQDCGPFAAMPPIRAVLMLQIYLGVTGSMALLLGASTCARGAAHRQLEEQNLHVRRLLDELDHRVKNNLAALIGLTQLARADATRAGLDRFEARVVAMGRAHDLLAQSHWTATHLSGLIRSAVGAEATEPGRLALSGDDPLIPAEQCQPLVLALHEMAEHSRRYGAWVAPVGEVSIRVAREGAATLVRWGEVPDRSHSNGDPASHSELRLARGFVVHELRGSMEVRNSPSGLDVTLRIPPRPPPAPGMGRRAAQPAATG